MRSKNVVLQRSMTTNHPIERLSDDELLTEVKRLASVDRCVTVDLVRALIALDSRRLYLGQGCASLFVYCTRILCFSEHAAYARIEAARAARRFPVILDLLHEGAITLTTVTLLGPHLTETNHRVVLDEARLRSKREVEQIVARLRPRPDVAPSVRRCPIRDGRRKPGSWLRRRATVPARSLNRTRSALHPGSRQAGGMGSGWRPLRVRGPGGPLRRDGVPGVPSSRPVRRLRRHGCFESSGQMSRP
jgi:hypothetical protein